jgi:hypothetical protein
MANPFDERFHISASRADWEREMARAGEEGMGDRPADRGAQDALCARRPGADGRRRAGVRLVIVDEAHHFENPETLGRRLLGGLADSAGQLILLTATPVQTHADNLLSLLRLLDHPAFTSGAVRAAPVRQREAGPGREGAADGRAHARGHSGGAARCGGARAVRGSRRAPTVRRPRVRARAAADRDEGARQAEQRNPMARCR